MSNSVTSLPATPHSSAKVNGPQAHPAPVPPEDINNAILAVIHTGVLGRRDALAHRSAVKYKARRFAHFGHFSSLCVTDLRDAFNDDRTARSRMAKNRRRTWLAMARYYARHAGIDQAIRIIALDRQGTYACQLVNKVARDDWQKFVQLGEQFGITEEALLGLCADAPALVARRPPRQVA